MRNGTQLMTLAFVALLALALVTAGCVTLNPSSVANPSPSNTSASTTAVSSGMVTYQNTSWGFKFRYPEGWHAIAPGNAETGFYFATQPFNDSMAYTIIFYKLYESPNNTDAALNKVNQFIATGKNSTAFDNYKVIQGPTRVTLGGVPAWTYTASYYYHYTERNTTGAVIWAVHGNYLYGISFGGSTEDYNRYLGTAQQIIDSFEFI